MRKAQSRDLKKGRCLNWACSKVPKRAEFKVTTFDQN
jgi:hypothetical protein